MRGPAMAALVVAAAGWLYGGGLAAEEARPLPFAGEGWQVEGKGAAATVDGRDALALEQGVAYRKDVALEDGVIEFDVQVTRRRSFVYVMFRMQDTREFEEFYLRAHKSGLPDSVQYAPVFQGHSGWQLYHGPGATAAIGFEPGAWTRVRVVLQGRKAALVVGDAPPLIVPHLARDPRPGFIALRTFVPPGTPGTEPAARFANVTVRPGPVSDAEFPAAPPAPATPPAPAATAAALVVPSWAVSGLLASPVAADPVPALPALGAMTTLAVEPGGFVHLHRHVTLAEGSRVGTAAARFHVAADREGPRAFDLGYSDVATVFVNGVPVYSGDQRYSFDTPRREGLLGFDQARLYLPLRAGDNEVVVVVSDGFGGWAVMGRFPDPGGLRVTAR